MKARHLLTTIGMAALMLSERETRNPKRYFRRQIINCRRKIIMKFPDTSANPYLSP